MKKRTVIGMMCAITMLAIAVASHFLLLDGLHGTFWSLLFQEDTRYSSKYSDRAFRRIRAKMPEAEITATLGTPLRVYPPRGFDDSTSLWFSESRTGKHFRMRTVSIRNGVVVGKHAEFYVD